MASRPARDGAVRLTLTQSADQPDAFAFFDRVDDWSVPRTLQAAKTPVLVGPGARSSQGWWSTRTPEGPGTLRLLITDRSIESASWGPGAGWLQHQLRSLLGENDERAIRFRPPEPFRRAWAAEPFRLGATGRPWDSLVGAVLGQKVQSTRAARSRRALARCFGSPAPGPRRGSILPSPETVAELGYHQFHSLGIERRRAATLIRAAREFTRIDQSNRTSTLDRLARVRGIGPWTLALVSATAFGDTDAVPVGDFHLPNTIAWHLAGEARADDRRMLRLLEPWEGERWRVVLLAKAAGKAPAYGPRLSLVSDGMTLGR